jgi:hypothetical protein
MLARPMCVQVTQTIAINMATSTRDDRQAERLDNVSEARLKETCCVAR